MALTLIPTEQVDENSASRTAWAFVAEAYQKALEVPGIPEQERQMFIRCGHKASRLARRSPFVVVKGGGA